MNKWFVRQMRKVSVKPVAYIYWLGVVTIMLILLLFFCFMLGRDFGVFWDGYHIDNALWGNFGDFVGGLFGPVLSLVSLVIVAWTFHEQQTLAQRTNRLQEKLSANSNLLQTQLQERVEKQNSIQQFNDLFFSLLDLYHKLVDDLSFFDNSVLPRQPYASYQSSDSNVLGSSPSVIRGKKFFSLYMDRLYNNFTPGARYGHNLRKATDMFSEVYNNHSMELSAYFRTVYRIFGLIRKSNISNEEKRKYSKIMRAQFTRPELFFLHYNARTQIGAPSAEIINIFRITKHLYLFDHPEFKPITAKFTKDAKNKREGLNLVFYHIRKTIYDIYKKRILPVNNRYEFSWSSKYQLTYQVSSESRVQLTLVIKKNAKKLIKILSGLRDLSPTDIQWLIHHFLRFVFVDSSYEKYCSIDDVVIKDLPIRTIQSTGDLMISTVLSHKENKPLRLSHQFWDS